MIRSVLDTLSSDDGPRVALHGQAGSAGQIIHMVWRSILARDLAFEDAALEGRRPLGGTGPMGGLETVGRYATLLPINPADRSALIAALNAGLGICVERADKPGEGQEAPPKKRRRRRRRHRGRKNRDGDGDAGSDGAGSDPDT